MSIISLKKVRKEYKMGETTVEALSDANVEIEDGDFVAIMGPSGSGKSTLMNMIGALDVPTDGEVNISSEDVSKFTEDELAILRSKKIGFIFQQFNLIPTMNARENVALPMLFTGVPKHERTKRAEELLEKVGLSDRMTHMPSELSGVQNAAGFYSSSEPVTYEGETEFVNVYGIDLTETDLIFGGQGWSIQQGRNLRSTDSTSALMGPEFRESYERDPEIGRQIDIEGNSFRIVGEITAGDPSAQNSVIIDIDRARQIFDLQDEELSQITVQTQSGFTQEEVIENIEQDLRRDRGLAEGDENFSTTTPQDILDSITNILNVVQGIVIGLASIALLVGGIGIMNTMYMSINERTQEIGVMKAIGATKGNIRTLFLIESGLIGFIGGVIGIIIGVAISEIVVLTVSEFTTYLITRGYDLNLLLGALTFSTVLGVISGYLPSRKASNLEPAEALRYE